MSYNFEISSSNFSIENKTEQSKSKALSQFHLHVQKGVVQKAEVQFIRKYFEPLPACRQHW